MSDESLVRGRITDNDFALMRQRVGYTNPTLRPGLRVAPWNPTVTADAVRRYATCCMGDDNPLYVDPTYARATRWKGVIAPPGFEWSMGWDRSPKTPPALDKETHKALRGVQLYHSGAEYHYYRPLAEGVELFKSEWLADIVKKESKFATRSAIVTNRNCFWDQNEQVALTSARWFVHAERRSLTEKSNGKAPDKPAWYSEAQREEIEAAYDQQYLRGADTLYVEDVKVGQQTPRMVKGPLTITDVINAHMGAGWVTYPNLPYKLAYENRKRVRGFYSLNEFNAWDSIQRVHWDRSLAHSIGVQNIYDIGPMRFMMLCHYLTNFAGDDAWIHRIRYELRNFNYIGDTTWLSGEITRAEIDPVLGPVVELQVTGVNHRGQKNIEGDATILVASRKHGGFKFPSSPPITEHRSPQPSVAGL